MRWPRARSRRRWRSRCPPTPNTCSRSSPGRRTPTTRSIITVNRDHTELILNMWTPQSGELRTLITGRRALLDQRGSLCGPDLPRRRLSAVPLALRARRLHAPLSLRAGRHAGPATDPGRLDDRLLGVEPAHPGPARPRRSGGNLGLLHHHPNQSAGAPDRPRQHRHRRAGASLTAAGIPSLRPVRRRQLPGGPVLRRRHAADHTDREDGRKRCGGAGRGCRACPGPAPSSPASS